MRNIFSIITSINCSLNSNIYANLSTYLPKLAELGHQFCSLAYKIALFNERQMRVILILRHCAYTFSLRRENNDFHNSFHIDRIILSFRSPCKPFFCFSFFCKFSAKEYGEISEPDAYIILLAIVATFSAFFA